MFSMKQIAVGYSYFHARKLVKLYGLDVLFVGKVTEGHFTNLKINKEVILLL